eukprot:TRINITY_DN2379_c0_g1_i1.p1 TRINITY_DN2379_c0_g1~~TRINITY_DN2379_c0_g1_i1.p1  ORF type:complete len:373 (+),score=61.49 TRINITY_DN2379_c0_g1_i1:1-1119(+)
MASSSLPSSPYCPILRYILYKTCCLLSLLFLACTLLIHLRIIPDHNADDRTNEELSSHLRSRGKVLAASLCVVSADEEIERVLSLLRLSAETWLTLTDARLHYTLLYPSNTSSSSSAMRPPLRLWRFQKDLHLRHSPRIRLRLQATKDLKDCRRQAGIHRMFAFKDDSYEDDEVIVILDPDVLPLKSSLLRDLDVYRRHNKVWIYQYDQSLREDSPFDMNLIGMTKRTWRTLLPESPQALDTLMNESTFLDDNGPSGSSVQLLLTKLILESELCSLPKNSSLWSRVGLAGAIRRLHPHFFNDIHSCFHGSGFESCDTDSLETGSKTKLEGLPCRLWRISSGDKPGVILQKQKGILKSSDKTFKLRDRLKNKI